MKRYLKLFAIVGMLVVLFLIGCDIGSQKEQKETITRVACVGDSITFRHGFDEEPENNYPTVLAEILGENYEVVNFGESGTCVQIDGDCAYVDQSVYQSGLDYDADVLIFMLGTNDSKEWNWNGEDSFREAYEGLLNQYSQKQDAPKIYICISPKAFYINAKISGAAEFGIEPANVEKIVDIQRQVALDRGYTIIDIYQLTSQHPEWLEEDGIHPTLEGARGIAEAVAEAIRNEEKE